MFRDTKEELARLERELLAEEPREEYPEETAEDEDWEDGLDILLDDPDDFGEEQPGIYQNYSNGYGRNQPSYHAYNSDQTDEDLEEFSEAVQEPERSNTGLIVTACLLMLGIAAVLIFWAFRYFL